jgi:hypothetical protein
LLFLKQEFDQLAQPRGIHRRCHLFRLMPDRIVDSFDIYYESDRSRLRPTFRVPSRRPRVRTQLGPPDDGRGEDDTGEEVTSKLVVAGCDPTEVLEPGKHALDHIALPVGFAVVRDQ